MSRLHPEIEKILTASDEERIRKIEDSKWIGYSRAKKIMDKLDDLLNHPKTLRMPNLLLVGDTNNGKTILVNRFNTIHEPRITAEDEKLNRHVVLIQAPHKPDERMFYNSLLDSLYVPYKFNDRVEKKQQQVIQLFSHIGVKMLIIDEIHHILAGSAMAQRTFLNMIKYLANELQIVIVGVGIKDAFNVINSDPQLANRFEPAVLPKWTMNDEYLRLLASFEYVLPLKESSNLSNHEIASKILLLSQGTIGEISTVIRKAAKNAIKSKSEKITIKILNNLDYIPPSERRSQINLIG
jgi:type II secretory pathway predicted ATPase ExeA